MNAQAQQLATILEYNDLLIGIFWKFVCMRGGFRERQRTYAQLREFCRSTIDTVVPGAFALAREAGLRDEALTDLLVAIRRRAQAIVAMLDTERPPKAKFKAIGDEVQNTFHELHPRIIEVLDRLTVQQLQASEAQQERRTPGSHENDGAYLRPQEAMMLLRGLVDPEATNAELQYCFQTLRDAGPPPRTQLVRNMKWVNTLDWRRIIEVLLKSQVPGEKLRGTVNRFVAAAKMLSKSATLPPS
jgi:hypothetical protein